MKTRVVEDKCCGFASCIVIAPDAFDLNDEQIAVPLIKGELPDHLLGAVREAINACPTKAIVLED